MFTLSKGHLSHLVFSNDKLLLEMSNNCKEFVNQFKIDSIIKKWLELFLEIDDNN